MGSRVRDRVNDRVRVRPGGVANVDGHAGFVEDILSADLVGRALAWVGSRGRRGGWGRHETV